MPNAAALENECVHAWTIASGSEPGQCQKCGLKAKDASKTPKFAVTKLVPGDVIDQYLQGKTSAQLAKEHGITRQALQAWLLRNDPEGWRHAQTAIAQEELDEAIDYRKSIQAKLEKADKEERDRLNIALALARDAEKSAQWRLERVCRRIYGQDVPQGSSDRVSITLNIGNAAAQDAEIVTELPKE